MHLRRQGQHVSYELVDSFYTLFTGRTGDEKSDEVLFDIQYSLNYLKGIEEFQPLPMNLYNKCWDECWPSRWLVTHYLEDTTASGEYSQRAWGSVTFGDNDPYVLPAPFTNADTSGRPLWKKYVYNPNSDRVNYEVGTNIILLRYADVLRSYAEAENKQGNTSNAIDAINQVRARAGAVPLPTSMTEQEVRTHLREVERPMELAMERVRWLDLLRWDDMESGYIWDTFHTHNRRAADNYSDEHKYYPIPFAETSTNSNIEE